MKLSTPLGDTMSYCFGNVLFRAAVPNHESLDREILDFLAAERKRDPDKVGRSIDGWRSQGNLFRRNVQALATLGDYIRRAVGTVVTEDLGPSVSEHGVALDMYLWANIYRDGNRGRMHSHMGGGSHYSGIYYVSTLGGDDVPDNGAIEFVDPRCIPWLALPGDPGDSSVRTLSVQPSDGTLLLFPSWLNHQVAPWRSSRGAERVSLAFNVTVRFADPHGAPPLRS